MKKCSCHRKCATNFPAQKRRQWFAPGSPTLRSGLRSLRLRPPPPDPALLKLDSGERAAIALTRSVKADGILMDDRAGVVAARALGFAVVGTLGVLDAAARRGLVDLAEALERLRKTTFRRTEELFDAMLKRHKSRA